MNIKSYTPTLANQDGHLSADSSPQLICDTIARFPQFSPGDVAACQASMVVEAIKPLSSSHQ